MSGHKTRVRGTESLRVHATYRGAGKYAPRVFSQGMNGFLALSSVDLRWEAKPFWKWRRSHLLVMPLADVSEIEVVKVFVHYGPAARLLVVHRGDGTQVAFQVSDQDAKRLLEADSLRGLVTTRPRLFRRRDRSGSGAS